MNSDMKPAEARLQELLDAELDGTLDAAGAAELEQRLATDPQARAARAQLQQMHAELSGLPEQPVPPGLRDAILAALPPGATNLSGPGRYVLPWPGRKRPAIGIQPLPSTSHTRQPSPRASAIVGVAYVGARLASQRDLRSTIRTSTSA